MNKLDDKQSDFLRWLIDYIDDDSFTVLKERPWHNTSAYTTVDCANGHIRYTRNTKELLKEIIDCNEYTCEQKDVLNGYINEYKEEYIKRQ